MFFVPGAVLSQKKFALGRAFDFLKRFRGGLPWGECSHLELIDALYYLTVTCNFNNKEPIHWSDLTVKFESAKSCHQCIQDLFTSLP